MKSSHVPQYTLRGVPARVDALLRRMAREEGKSLNEVAIEVLRRGVGLLPDEEGARFHDLDPLIGTWVDDPEFDAAIQAFETIDPELWE